MKKSIHYSILINPLKSIKTTIKFIIFKTILFNISRIGSDLKKLIKKVHKFDCMVLKKHFLILKEVYPSTNEEAK